MPPIRTKEWAYVDVLSESINNPIRLLLGWFALVTSHVPPASLAISYWMAGAFLMAVKRYAEYRHIGNPEAAAAALADVRETASGDGNLLPPMREALRARCTVGEICGALRELWGTYDGR